MKDFHVNLRKRLSRRAVLRGSSAALVMPWLSAMTPAFATATDTKSPQRFVAMTLGLGLHGPNLVPKTNGKDYEPSRYLKQLQDIRDEFTVISGTSHPGVKGGHRAEASLLSAAPMSASAASRNTISFDQLLAKHLGHRTRFPSLVLGLAGSNSPSYTQNGTMIPAEDSPSKLFTQLFVNDTPQQQKQNIERAKRGQSIMDLVAEDTRSLQRDLGAGDRDRLDAYFTSVRDLEKRLVESEAWATRPKPDVDQGSPVDITNGNDFIGRQRLMSDMVRLALTTDSTRFVSLHLGGSGGVLPIKGVENGYHSLSHHGQDEEKLEQLALIRNGDQANPVPDLFFCAHMRRGSSLCRQ